MEEAITLIENTAGNLAKHLVNVNTKHIKITGDVDHDDLIFLSAYLKQKESLALSIEATGAETIWNPAFAECDSLTAIHLPHTQSLGSAFYGCTSLITADLPQTAEVWNWAFADCIALASVRLPQAANIGDEAFRHCRRLTSVHFPHAVHIGQKAFYGCTSLATICLPGAVSIGNEAFVGCTALRKLVIAGTEKCKIGHSALSALPALFLKDAVYPDADSLACAWSHWGYENRCWWDRYDWPEIHSNYTGQGDVDDPENYALHWTRPASND